MKLRPDLAVEKADGELIVLDKAAGKVHQLNASATFVWTCLSDGVGVDEIALMLAEAFDIELETAQSDVETVLTQLKELALVVQ